MKTIKTILASVVLVCGATSASAAVITSTGTKPAVGNGNSGSPYEIWTAEELRWFVHYENTRHWFPDDHAKLMCDIDLSTICGPDKGSWIPLGNPEESGAQGYWSGKFYGNGHTVSGLYIDSKDIGNAIVGFFGNIKGCTIADLTLKGNIYVNTCSHTGSLAGMISSGKVNISNCVSYVDIDIDVYTGSTSYVGGLIALIGSSQSNGYISQCTYQGILTGFCGYQGSLIAWHNGTADIQQCSGYSNGRLSLIAHSSETHTISNCISDTYIISEYYGESQYRESEGATLRNNIYIKGEYEYKSDNVIVDTEGSEAVEATALTSGAACFRMNQKMSGKYFTQNIDTDFIPIAGTQRSTVYQVKKYTQCGTDNWEWAYSNTDEDDTTLREHTFDSEHAYCTRCGDAVNPEYGITKDAEGYYIATCTEDIKWLWNLVNVTGVTDANIRLGNDIDMAGEAMEPLTLFSGIFDGRGHTLSNINISCTGVARVGLVGKLYGTIRNLTLSGNVESSYASYLGAFAAYVYKGATISNVRNDCTVKMTGTIGGEVYTYIGGVAGYSDGSITYAINNGPVVDASICTGTLRRYIAGVAGYVIPYTEVSHLTNNGVVGATGTAAQAGNGSSVVNVRDDSYYTDSYYMGRISNPGLEYFFSDNHTTTDVMIMPNDVAGGRLAWLLAGKDYDPSDNDTHFFGQTIGTDLVPYPGVSDDHKGVYNKKLYYTCSDYSEYSNSPEDGSPTEHDFDANRHFCTVCYAIDEKYVPKDPESKAYLISTEDQFIIFGDALFEARGSSKPMKYASASIQNDLDFSANSNYQEIYILYGRLHGNGHKIKLGDKDKDIVHSIESDGVVEYLDVEFQNASTKHLASYNYGRVVGCNVKGGIPAHFSYGIVNDCTGENLDGFIVEGRYSNCLVKNYTDGIADCYRLYNSTVQPRNPATYSEISLEQGPSGALAYRLSRASTECIWGQRLGVDADPRAVYAQTPESSTYVTRLTTYSTANVFGEEGYFNAGGTLHAVPGSYSVSAEPEVWKSVPISNFIVDCGGDTFTAEAIDLQPGVAHHMPMQLFSDRFSYDESFAADEYVSLIFPVDMPASNIAGDIYLFNSYKPEEGKIYFSAFKDFDYLPANTPVVVRAYGGSILTEDVLETTVMPMAGAISSVRGNAEHSISYRSYTLPAEVISTDEGLNMAYYMMRGTKAHAAASLGAPRREASEITDALSAVSAIGIDAEEDRTVAPFEGYFAIPVDSSETAPASLQIVLNEKAPDVPTCIDDAALDSQDLYPCRVTTLSGVVVTTAGNRDELRSLHRGIYILTSANKTFKLAIP